MELDLGLTLKSNSWALHYPMPGLVQHLNAKVTIILWQKSIIDLCSYNEKVQFQESFIRLFPK